MSMILRVLKWFFYGALLASGVAIISIFCLIYFWNSHSVNSQGEAKNLLEKYGQEEYKIMLSECSLLLDRGEDVMLNRDEIPIGLKTISLEYVRVSGNSCELNLFKVPGKGMGYFVSKTRERNLEISWHNYFESWDSHTINIDK